MSSAKNSRMATIGLGLARVNLPDPPVQNRESTPPARVIAGAVGAVSRSLDQFQTDMRAAQDLISSGQAVIELDADCIEGSFLKDRLGADPQEQDALAASIRDHGQQVPILVRRHPHDAQRYQLAYGHRRLDACRMIGRKVRAIVRDLDDIELLVAQGQENSARKNLSFIERALFALRMEQRGIARDAIMAALSTDKTELSKLLSVAASVPGDIITVIGAAPKAGRPRWMGLAEGLKSPQGEKRLRQIIATTAFVGEPSDQRFNLAFAALHATARRGEEGEAVRSADGTEIARSMSRAKVVNLIFEGSKYGDFGRFVIANLPQLFDTFKRRDT